MDLQHDAKQIIDRSLQTVLPDAAVRRALEEHPIDRGATVIAIGKAAWRMARAAQQVLGERLKSGIVITKYGHSEGPLPRMTIFEAGHPVPDAHGVEATRQALRLADSLTQEDVVIFLVSGGGSALFEMPLEGVSLEDIAGITRQLLACGADIVEINTLRKHLSAVKGGRFAERCAPARVLAIVLSDVLGDPLDSIASGPACPDSSTCQDVKAIIARHHLRIPDHVLPALSMETPKRILNAEHIVTGNVRALCSAAMREAAALGYAPLLLTTTLSCEAREAGAMLAGQGNPRVGQSPARAVRRDPRRGDPRPPARKWPRRTQSGACPRRSRRPERPSGHASLLPGLGWHRRPHRCGRRHGDGGICLRLPGARPFHRGKPGQ